MFDQARTLDLAQRSNEVYVQSYSVTAAIGQTLDESVPDSTTKLQFVTEEDKITAAAAQRPGSKQKCFFCGNNAHARRFCPAKDASCHNCSKKGHFSKVCKSNTTSTGTSASCTPILATVTAASPQCLKKVVINVRVNERPCKALIDTAASSVDPPELFATLTSECRPIATKSRKYSTVDREFIEKETTRLLTEGIIEPSMSPWRAQVLVTSNERHKKRLVIDYSQTLNRFTELDAYPFLTLIKWSQISPNNKVYSTLDLRSAYHQIPLREHEKK
ncbi:Hypothetical predicted protein [Mytilus galloprovincialis]|uniref:CCHC-type domain-containing protein n=1 Tax=Mytilus galloprovincialis TaxID=29158 RepID=A0A8B6DG28_MYTGA|nr:Hypothetical predicted protein [Mytilus galloprovincialis]